MNFFKKTKYYILLIILICANNSQAMDGEREGGDIVSCSANSSESRYDGYYSLDYILTRTNHFSENKDTYKFQEGLSCEEHIALIQNKLKSMFPSNPIYASLGAGLELYMDSFKNKQGRGRTWFRAPKGTLKNIHDEQMVRKLPKNCSQSKPVQLFVRRQYSNRKQYDYDEYYYNEIKKNPLQCSYSHIHEWVRDFLPNAGNINPVVDLFHSKLLLEETADPDKTREALIQKFINLGVFQNYNKGICAYCSSRVLSGHDEVQRTMNFLIDQYECITSNLIDDTYSSSPPPVDAETAEKQRIKKKLTARILNLRDKMVTLLDVPKPIGEINEVADLFKSEDDYKHCIDPLYYSYLNPVNWMTDYFRTVDCFEGVKRIVKTANAFNAIEVHKQLQVFKDIDNLKFYINHLTPEWQNKLKDYPIQIYQIVFDEDYVQRIKTLRGDDALLRCMSAYGFLSNVTLSETHCMLNEYLEEIKLYKKLVQDRRKILFNKIDSILLEIDGM